MYDMKILIACEESQIVCTEFRKIGFEAYSCDIQKQSGNHPEWHIQNNVLNIINGNCFFYTNDFVVHYVEKWDLIIAHPPCTYLSNAGANSLFKKIDGKSYINFERFKKGMEGKEFFMSMLSANCEHIAVENPIPSTVFQLPSYSQIIQPYQFGEIYSKKTCLWLKNLPLLKPTKYIENHVPYIVSGSYSKTHDPKYKGVSRKGGAAKIRSKTFPGIAKAMADQWGNFLINNLI